MINMNTTPAVRFGTQQPESGEPQEPKKSFDGARFNLRADRVEEVVNKTKLKAKEGLETAKDVWAKRNEPEVKEAVQEKVAEVKEKASKFLSKFRKEKPEGEE